MIVGRKQEVKLLKNCLLEDESKLIAIYGRRRVGKTFLIREVYKSKMVFELTGLYQGKMRDQLRNFHNQLQLSSKQYKSATPPKTWFDAFQLLTNYLDRLKGKSKKVIFIDEFPWVSSSRSKFLMWFEHFWNTYCTNRKDLVVVVCGSAASFMVQKIIRNRGGLHGRLSHRIQLEPFNLHETEQYLKSKRIHFEKYDILQLYMSIGGIPFYLNQIEKGLSVVQNIDKLCFQKGGALVNEFDESLLSLFTNSDKHRLIIEKLATNKRGVSRTELVKKCRVTDNGNFSKALFELIESGFVTMYSPFQKRKKTALFRLSDEYCLFYLKFIKPNMAQGVGTFENLFQKQTYKSWTGFAFEGVCLKHTYQIKKALGIDRIYSINSSWSNKAAQIDLVIDRDDNRINICEIKFCNGPYTIDKRYANNLRNKLFEFEKEMKSRKYVALTMITTFGVKQNSHSLGIMEDDVRMESLFES